MLDEFSIDEEFLVNIREKLAKIEELVEEVLDEADAYKEYYYDKVGFELDIAEIPKIGKTLHEVKANVYTIKIY